MFLHSLALKATYTPRGGKFDLLFQMCIATRLSGGAQEEGGGGGGAFWKDLAANAFLECPSFQRLPQRQVGNWFKFRLVDGTLVSTVFISGYHRV